MYHGHQALPSYRNYNIIAMAIKHCKITNTTILLPLLSAIKRYRHYNIIAMAIKDFKVRDITILLPWSSRELSGRVLDSRLRSHWSKPHRRHCVVSLSMNIYPSLVLVQPRKTNPFITERLLMGHKESNQTKQSLSHLALQSNRHYNIITMVIEHYKIIDTTILLPWSSSITKLKTLQCYCYGHQALQN